MTILKFVINQESRSYFYSEFVPLCTVLIIILRVIPQGTVDTNLGPDHLAVPAKSSRSQQLQTTNPFNYTTFVLKLTVHGIEFRLFGAMAYNRYYYLYY